MKSTFYNDSAMACHFVVSEMNVLLLCSVLVLFLLFIFFTYSSFNVCSLWRINVFNVQAGAAVSGRLRRIQLYVTVGPNCKL